MATVQILASALPGFRDLRGPIFAGYMWLLFAWIIVQPNVGQRPHGTVAASLYDLGGEVGQIWVAAAVSVAAYLIGSISQALSNNLQNYGQEIFWDGFRFDREDQIKPIQVRGEKQLRSMESLGESIPGERLRDLHEGLLERAEAAEREAARELELPAILLVGEQSELFAEVDRLRAEGELRVAVTPPLFAIGILLTAMFSFWWLLALPCIFVLFIQGIKRIADSKMSIAEAIRLGRISSASPAKFATWVDDTLPELLQSAKEEQQAREERRRAAVVPD